MQATKMVELLTLRVLVSGNDAEGWMAQGLEIDYFAYAKTEESVREKFFEGLIGTIEFYLREADEESLEDFLSQPAPKEVWKEFREAHSVNQKRLSIQAEIPEEAFEAPREVFEVFEEVLEVSGEAVKAASRPLSGQVSFFALRSATT